HAAELQHRRNVFRGMSHMTGVQAGALIRCGIVRRMPDDPERVELLLLGGLVDLRLLWEIERVNVFRSRTFGTGQGPGYRKEIVRTPISDQEGLGGYLLENYCSSPAPNVEMVSGEAGWIYGNLLDGRVGATAESTMFFGVRYRHIPNPAGREGEYGARSLIDLPVKVYVADMLIEHDLAPDWTPQVQVLIGSSSSDQPSPPGIERSLPSQLDFEFLGTGPSIVKELRTYPEMVRGVAAQAGCDVSGFDCWRLRVEYPLYGSEIVSELVEPERQE
ncbi:MAG TPA: hypothetical protein VM452_20705, partial [Caulifigura sp.]|nr:hypothetical protein [Caulifigura sp.]